ncbi:hypothetical protein ABZ712_23535 [Streptomyces sp. NPDC006906]|uniref:hypothetical protein n=1 Tax=Streptomyces sp. NPDC006906 TaxID=3154782 RepID=UPI0033D8B38E
MGAIQKWWRRPQTVAPSSIPVLDEASSTDIVKDYYSRNLASAETARARAQTAFTIISALATLFVGGAAFAGVSTQQVYVKVAMLLAASLWLTATFLYAQSATGTFSSITPKQGGLKVTAAEVATVATSVVALVQTERDLVRWKNRHANSAAFAAASASIIAIGLIWLLPPESLDRTVVKLTESGQTAIREICHGRSKNEITATVNREDLSKKYITLEDVDAESCQKASELTIPAKWIDAVVARR